MADRTPEQIADGLAEDERECLLHRGRTQGYFYEACISLQGRRIYDARFELTDFGRDVREVLVRKAAAGG